MAGEGETRGPEYEAPVARWSAGETEAGGARTADGAVELIDGPADVLIRRLFSVGLDLHAALAHLEEHIAEEVAVARIHGAIVGLDEAIKDIRRAVFALWPQEPAIPGGVRSMVVDAVKRVCGPARGEPAITLGSGVDAIADAQTSQRIAEVVQEVLALVPGDRLAYAHVEVIPARRPAAGLIVQIDVPGGDLADVAGLLVGTGGNDVVVSSQMLAGPPGGSRIRLECPAAVG